jgi:2-polyprenyl-3-methyl-5-hydroxy-6-metoxy-1,4-benzoquinol methylase
MEKMPTSALVNITPMEPCHAEAVAQLARELGYRTSSEEIRERRGRATAPGEAAVVATDASATVTGWMHLQLTHSLHESAAVEIVALVVSSERRSQGIGRRLVEWALVWARDPGVSRVVVRSRVQRVDAHRFYTSVGFAVTKQSLGFERAVDLAGPAVEHLSTREAYDLWSEVYEVDGNPLTVLDDRRFHSVIAADLSGQRALDMGCGTGRLSLELARRGAQVTGVDFSARMLAAARAQAVRDGLAIEFVEHDMHEPLTFNRGSYDLVTSGLVLEHIENLGAFFKQMASFMKPGAQAYVSAMHPVLMLRGTQASFKDPRTGTRIRPVSYSHSVADVQRAMRESGLSLVDFWEDKPSEDLMQQYPRAVPYAGWPILAAFQLRC